MKLFGSRHRRAFTLLEVLVASTVLALAIFGLMGAFGTSAALRQTSKQSEVIQRVIRARIAELRQRDTVGGVRTEITNDPTVVATGALTEGSTSTGAAIPSGVEIVSSSLRIMTEAESAAAFPGFSAAGFDFDRNGTPNESSSDSNAYGTVIPVEMTVTWRDAQGSATNRTLTVRTLIYPRSSINTGT